MKLTVVGNGTLGTWEVHKDGCKDIQKSKRKMGADAEIERGFQSLEDIVEFVYGDEADEMGYGVSDLDTKPCACGK